MNSELSSSDLQPPTSAAPVSVDVDAIGNSSLSDPSSPTSLSREGIALRVGIVNHLDNAIVFVAPLLPELFAKK